MSGWREAHREYAEKHGSSQHFGSGEYPPLKFW